MEGKLKYIDSLISSAESYTKTSIELFKLKAIDRIADVVSDLISSLPFIIALILFFITLNFGISLWLGAVLGKDYLGFLAVAGFYLFAGIILYLIKKWIKKPLNDSIINQMLS